MKHILLAALLSFCFIGMVSADEKTQTPVAPPVPKTGTSLDPATLHVYKFKAEWCGPCKEMERTVWPDQRVKDVLARYKGVHKFDADNPDDQKYFKYYGVDGIPALIVVDKDGKVVKHAKGQMTADEVVTFLSRVEVSDGPVKPVIFGTIVSIAMILFRFFWFLFGL